MAMNVVGMRRPETTEERQRAPESGRRLPLRQAALIWLASGAVGWLLTMGLVWAAVQAL